MTPRLCESGVGAALEAIVILLQEGKGHVPQSEQAPLGRAGCAGPTSVHPYSTWHVPGKQLALNKSL